MTKSDLIQKLAEATDSTQKSASTFLNAFTDIIGDELAKNEDVILMGFGKFSTTFVKGREGRNPRNPEETLKIPDTMRVHFSAGSKLKEKVNSSLKGGKKKK